MAWPLPMLLPRTLRLGPCHARWSGSGASAKFLPRSCPCRSDPGEALSPAQPSAERKRSFACRGLPHARPSCHEAAPRRLLQVRFLQRSASALYGTAAANVGVAARARHHLLSIGHHVADQVDGARLLEADSVGRRASRGRTKLHSSALLWLAACCANHLEPSRKGGGSNWCAV